MRLSEFISANRQTIISEWDSFARSCAPASGSMDIRALADHASEMLTVIAKDLDTVQGAAEQSDKSKGLARAVDGTRPSAASEHGASRAESGFTVEQMVAEFRALRASVIRLWTANQGTLDAASVNDLTRFNEAIDQALAESVSRYTQDLDHSKEMFLAILGHDLRSPLGAVTMSAEFMLETGELLEPHLTLTKRISSSAKRMQHMIGDLLDFTRSRLGGGIPITRAGMSMEKTVHDVVDEVAAAHPTRKIKVDARGGQRGEWDCQRISQALTNVLGNALEHGSTNGIVTVRVDGNDSEACISVHNYGAAISPEQLNGIFGSMKGSTHTDGQGSYGNLGLGLYIAERIVHAHGGTIAVSSSNEEGTTFTMKLPRHAT